LVVFCKYGVVTEIGRRRVEVYAVMFDSDRFERLRKTLVREFDVHGTPRMCGLQRSVVVTSAWIVPGETKKRLRYGPNASLSVRDGWSRRVSWPGQMRDGRLQQLTTAATRCGGLITASCVYRIGRRAKERS
jgi:hypothetical protein